MSIHVNWNDDTAKSAIVVVYDRSWSWTDFADAKVQIDSLLNSVEYNVDILSDSSQSGGLPGGNALSVLSRSFQSAPSNIGKVVVLGANPFFKSLLQILQTVSLNRAAKNIHFVKSSDEAHSLLKTA